MDQSIAALLCFLSGVRLAVCGLGVVTLLAGPLEPLSGVLSQIIIKAAPFDPPPLLFDIRTLPLCIHKERTAYVCVHWD